MTPAWGPLPLDQGRTRFRLWAPGRSEVSLEIEGETPIAMGRAPDGWFEVGVMSPPGTHYRFRFKDGLAVADPASRQQAGGVHGWSVVADQHGHAWRNDNWRGRPWAETVIMEVHAGVLGGFPGVAQRLAGWADLGITAIQLMPVPAFAGSRNWGYDGVLPYAVAESYGTTDDLKELVDRAHDLGLSIFLDVVYNHFGPDGNYLGAYAPDFFDTHTDTPWGQAVAISSDPVRRFFIDNALMWLGEYRFDGLRFDAVHAIADDGFLDDMAHELRAAFPGRHVHLILENERNDPNRLAAGLYDAQWNDDFHNALHVLLTGESESYYEAFSHEPTTLLARALAEGFAYQGETMAGSDHQRGMPSGHLPTTAFVSFLQNHDQIGNRAMGERLIALCSPDKLRAATALLLLCPQVPMLFMGEDEGSTSPFLFFTDFHDELADAVRNGRRREFARFAAFSDPAMRERIPDPNALSTFDASRPEPGPAADEWRAFYSRLLKIRQREIAPRLAGTKGEEALVLGEGAIRAQWRMGDGARLTIAFNLGEARVTVPAAEGKKLFSFGGTGAPASITAWLSS